MYMKGESGVNVRIAESGVFRKGQSVNATLLAQKGHKLKEHESNNANQ